MKMRQERMYEVPLKRFSKALSRVHTTDVRNTTEQLKAHRQDPNVDDKSTHIFIQLASYCISGYIYTTSYILSDF